MGGLDAEQWQDWSDHVAISLVIMLTSSHPPPPTTTTTTTLVEYSNVAYVYLTALELHSRVGQFYPICRVPMVTTGALSGFGWGGESTHSLLEGYVQAPCIDVGLSNVSRKL